MIMIFLNVPYRIIPKFYKFITSSRLFVAYLDSLREQYVMSKKRILKVIVY